MDRLNLVDPVPSFDEKAIDAVTRSVMSKIDEKTHGLALRNLSMVIAWAGKYEEAYKLASEAVRMVPLDTDANFLLGLCAMALAKLDEAERAFKKAMELAPQAASPYTYLGDLYQRQGLNEQAIAQYRKALARDPDARHPTMEALVNDLTRVPGATSSVCNSTTRSTA